MPPSPIPAAREACRECRRTPTLPRSNQFAFLRPDSQPDASPPNDSRPKSFAAPLRVPNPALSDPEPAKGKSNGCPLWLNLFLYSICAHLRESAAKSCFLCGLCVLGGKPGAIVSTPSATAPPAVLLFCNQACHR